MDLSHRGLFWLVVVGAVIVLGHVAGGFTLLFSRSESRTMAEIVAVLFLTFVLSPVVWIAGWLMQCLKPTDLPTLPIIGLYVFLLSTILFGLRRLAAPAGIAPFAADAVTDPAAPEKPRLLRRLAADQQADILRLSANGHHIEVATASGTETIRMRLSDAVDEMEPVDGFYIHRSHWVARDAIVEAERENAHRVFVVLTNGDRLPASRSYRPLLEERGIL